MLLGICGLNWFWVVLVFFLPDRSLAVGFAVYAFCLLCWPTAIVCVTVLVLSPNMSL